MIILAFHQKRLICAKQKTALLTLCSSKNSSILFSCMLRKVCLYKYESLNLLAHNESISVSNSIHKAFIEIGEEGTEAAAATVLILPILLSICTIVSSDVQIDELTKGISTFASDFYQQSAQAQPGNLIISPFSVATALALLSQAANESTLDELKNGLNLKGDKSNVADQYLSYHGLLQKSAGNATLSIANQLYVNKDYSLNKNFREIAVQKFLSGVESVDFTKSAETAQLINHFVEEMTHDKIKNLVKPDSFDKFSRVVLVNAVYMKANWHIEFNPLYTSKKDFHLSETETTSVDFMHKLKSFNYAVLSDLDATALEMRYSDSDLSFVIVLPNSRTGISALEAKLKNYDFTTITNQMEDQFVKVAIPKFKIESEIDLKDALKNMGIGEMFDDGKANLSGLLEKFERVFVSKAVHKAFIEINEAETEAAAASSFDFLVPLSGIVFTVEPPKFHADHPFVYYIWDKNTKTIIFSGRLVNP